MKKILSIIIIILFIFAASLRAKADEEILLLFDTSVSMMDNLNGTPKYIQAVNAAKEVLKNTNPSRRIGMRIIGIKFDKDILSYVSNPDKMCKATSLLNPINVNNINKISSRLDTLIPLGTTPLTYSLSVAIAEDFHNGNDLKHIILITDGAESCNMNPCQFIKEIMLYRKDIQIDVIAINVEGEVELGQLKCLTEQTNGKLLPIINESELKTAFQNSIQSNNMHINSDMKAETKVDTVNPANKKNNPENNKTVIYKNYLFEF